MERKISGRAFRISGRAFRFPQMVFRIVLPALILLFSAAINAGAQQLLESLHPQPRQAYLRFLSAAYAPAAGHVLFLDPQKPAWDVAWQLNAEFRLRGLDTLEVRPWLPLDSLEAGIFLGVHSDFINTLLASIPDQRISVTPGYPGPEGYVVDVMPSRVLISGSDEAGLSYGAGTFLQLLHDYGGVLGAEAARVVDRPEFPVRWFYYPTNVLVGANITAAKQIWDQALQSRLNGVHLVDSKFTRLTTLPQRYFDSLTALKRYAADRRLEIIPGVMPFGYSNSVLFHDPNMASGLPVRAQRFVIEADTGRLLPKTDVSMSNGGFETHTGNSFPGFTFIDQPGDLSFADTDIKHSGDAAIRFENFTEHSPQHGHGRVSYWSPVTPFTQYHVRGWVRTDDLRPASSVNVAVLSNAGYNLAYNRFSVAATTGGWQRLEFTFNSLEADTVGIYWGVWGARTGRIWWDDLALEETSFINLLRRPGTPLTVGHPLLTVTYAEGVDYDTLRDPLSGTVPYNGVFTKFHTPPTFRTRSGGALRGGDTVLISYYHAVVMYSEQVAATMSEPELYETLDREFNILDSLLESKRYFMQHDEIRTMNWDAGDRAQAMSPAQLLAGNVDKCVEIIRRHRPDADVWVWSDMFDEYHNAVKGPYYLVRGDLRGSADLISKEIGMVNWNGREGIVQNSLGFFEKKKFRQISAPFYDNDENHIRIWKQWTRETGNFSGMMYTTWSRDYDYLRAFGEYAWNHAPYIYFMPMNELRPGKTISFPVSVRGDEYDADWQLEGAELKYRTSPGEQFAAVAFHPVPGVPDFVDVDIPEDATWLQWFVTATDNRGWTTRVPFGDSVFFELGAIATGSEASNAPAGFQLYGGYPNPAGPGGVVTVEWSAAAGSVVDISLQSVLGRDIVRETRRSQRSGYQQLRVDIKNLPSGLYFIRASDGRTVDVKALVKL